MKRNAIPVLLWLALCLATALAVNKTVGYLAPMAAVCALIAAGGSTLIWLRD